MAAVLATVIGGLRGGWAGALLEQPAAWTVPTAFLVTMLVSIATPSRIPRGTARTMVRLHTPENLVLDRAPR
jgi:cation/acetate symporter